MAPQQLRHLFLRTTSHEFAQRTMVPNPAPEASEKIPLLTRSTTLPPNVPKLAPDRTLLAPEDAIYHGSPPRKPSAAVNRLQQNLRMTNGDAGVIPGRRTPRSRSRRRKRAWSKLLWVKQSCELFSPPRQSLQSLIQTRPR
jgi:phosphatidylinositol glycan class C protein